MSMKELDEKIEKFKKWQDKVHAELERRTKVEQEAEELICQGKMQEAMELLNTLDDEKFRRMIESEDGEIEEEPEEEVVDTEQTDEEEDAETSKEYVNEKAADCMVRHLEAFHRQSTNNIVANFGAPCSNCKDAIDCRFDYIKRRKPLLELSSENFTVVRKQALPEDKIDKVVIEEEYNELCIEVIREGKRRVQLQKADEETMELLATSAKMVSQILYFGH